MIAEVGTYIRKEGTLKKQSVMIFDTIAESESWAKEQSTKLDALFVVEVQKVVGGSKPEYSCWWDNEMRSRNEVEVIMKCRSTAMNGNKIATGGFWFELTSNAIVTATIAVLLPLIIMALIADVIYQIIQISKMK